MTYFEKMTVFRQDLGERIMSRTIEELLNSPYWIIDILPEQVPAGGTGQYFTIEHYLRRTQLSEIKKKHLNMLLKLNCYRDISLDEGGMINPPPEQRVTPQAACAGA